MWTRARGASLLAVAVCALALAGPASARQQVISLGFVDAYWKGHAVRGSISVAVPKAWRLKGGRQFPTYSAKVANGCEVEFLFIGAGGYERSTRDFSAIRSTIKAGTFPSVMPFPDSTYQLLDYGLFGAGGFWYSGSQGLDWTAVTLVQPVGPHASVGLKITSELYWAACGITKADIDGFKADFAGIARSAKSTVRIVSVKRPAFTG